MTFATLPDVPTDATPPDEMRLDELARRAGVASTTVRLYQAKGLLPGPRIVGRTGYYEPHHLTRLHLIARLQDEGFSLAGIGRLLDSWEHGRDLAALVGVEEQLDALLHGADAVVLDPGELMARFPGGTLTPDLLARATSLGLVESTDDGQVRVPDRRFLETGTALVGLGLPASVVLDEWEKLVGLTDEIAERFIALFTTHLVSPNWRDDMDSDAAARLADVLTQLRQQAGQVLLSAFDGSIARKGGESLAALLDGATD
jgi:DNA-binding transcriptional MerR regulator